MKILNDLEKKIMGLQSEPLIITKYRKGEYFGTLLSDWKGEGAPLEEPIPLDYEREELCPYY